MNNTSAQIVPGRLILFPSTMAAGTAPANVLPELNLRLLGQVKYFVVEELRTARRFLRACSREIVIDELHFEVLNEHTPATEVEGMLAPLAQGYDVGVISEAGCPAVADPGADLVAAAQRRGYEVLPLVGPSSILLALMGSGFNGQSFAFEGYLPMEARARAARLKEMERLIRNRRQTQIFIETPYRNNRLIGELCRALPGDMLLCVASDLTGPAQSVLTLPLRNWAAREYNYDKTPTIFLLYSPQ